MHLPNVLTRVFMILRRLCHVDPQMFFSAPFLLRVGVRISQLFRWVFCILYAFSYSHIEFPRGMGGEETLKRRASWNECSGYCQMPAELSQYSCFLSSLIWCLMNNMGFECLMVDAIENKLPSEEMVHQSAPGIEEMCIFNWFLFLGNREIFSVV